MKTAILGAGVSGLALARELLDLGFPADRVHLFEADAVAGGLCRSKTVEGFTYDVTGGHILFSKDAATMQWMKDQAGGDECFVERDRNTKIRFGDAWVHYPFENGLGDLPKQANFDCLDGYVRAWHQRQVDGSDAPRDFASWVRWRFGEGIAKHFMDPYNEKIWKRPLEQISSSWVAGRVPDAPIADVLKAAIGLRTEGYVHQSIFYYPKHGGFQAITDGLAASLASRIRLATPVTELERRGDTWYVNGEAFDCVVTTLALNDLPAVLPAMPSGPAEAMRSLEFNSMTCFLLALDRPEHPDLSWVYLPHAEQGPANRITYMSNYSPNNAPAGKTSFLCEVTNDGRAPFPGPELERAVVDGMVRAGLLAPEELLFTDSHRTKYAYIVFDHDYDARRRAAFDWLDAVDLIPLGRFGRYEYDNSDQCVIKARRLAAKLVERAADGRPA